MCGFSCRRRERDHDKFRLEREKAELAQELSRLTGDMSFQEVRRCVRSVAMCSAVQVSHGRQQLHVDGTAFAPKCKLVKVCCHPGSNTPAAEQHYDSICLCTLVVWDALDIPLAPVFTQHIEGGVQDGAFDAL